MITWFKDGVELQSHAFAYISELAIDSNRIQSKLEIDPAKQMDTGTYECQADNVHAVDRKQFKADFWLFLVLFGPSELDWQLV